MCVCWETVPFQFTIVLACTCTVRADCEEVNVVRASVLSLPLGEHGVGGASVSDDNRDFDHIRARSEVLPTNTHTLYMYTPSTRDAIVMTLRVSPER